MQEYNLFQTEFIQSYHFVIVDGCHNPRNIFVFALSLNDALIQARNQAFRLGYCLPYKILSAEKLPP